jgi:hypothetical protein
MLSQQLLLRCHRTLLQEAHTLLSAAAVALSHAHIAWPLLLPVHDAVRDAYWGVAAGSGGGSTLRLDTDSLHSSRPPQEPLQLDRQLLLLSRQLAAAGAPAAAAACRAAAGTHGLDARPPTSMAADAAAAGSSAGSPAAPGGALRVALAMRHSYALPADAGDGSNGWEEEESGAACSGIGGSGEWDAEAPWRPWAAQADPVGERPLLARLTKQPMRGAKAMIEHVRLRRAQRLPSPIHLPHPLANRLPRLFAGCLELDVVWRFPSASEALQAQAAAGSEALAPLHAAQWRLLALSGSYERDTGHRGFVLRAGKHNSLLHA